MMILFAVDNITGLMTHVNNVVVAEHIGLTGARELMTQWKKLNRQKLITKK